MRKLTAIFLSVTMAVSILLLCACGTEDEIKPLSKEEFQEKWKVTSSCKKVILDADLAYFFDDVYALQALLKADELGYLELCAITTCCGNTYVAASTYDTLAYLDYVGRSDVPVYVGSDELISGLVDIQEVERVSGVLPFKGFYDLMNRYTKDYKKVAEIGATSWKGNAPKSVPKEQSAEDYIIEEIHKNPGEVTIVALGGLTNVARAIKKDPSISQDAAGIIYMGGVFDVCGEAIEDQEFNFWCDPKASNIALGAGWKRQVIISHDAATTCLKGYDTYQMALKQNHNPFTNAFVEYYNKGCKNQDDVKRKFETDLPYCWDPITVAYILKPEMCTSIEKRYVWVDDRMGPTYGSTLNWKEGNQPENSYPAQVVLSVDRNKFWNFMFDLYDVK